MMEVRWYSQAIKIYNIWTKWKMNYSNPLFSLTPSTKLGPVSIFLHISLLHSSWQSMWGHLSWPTCKPHPPFHIRHHDPPRSFHFITSPIRIHSTKQNPDSFSSFFLQPEPASIRKRGTRSTLPIAIFFQPYPLSIQSANSAWRRTTHLSIIIQSLRSAHLHHSL